MVLRSSSHKAQVGSPVAHIVLTGESALDEVFLDVVRDALSDVLAEAVPFLFTEASVTKMQQQKARRK